MVKLLAVSACMMALFGATEETLSPAYGQPSQYPHQIFDYGNHDSIRGTHGISSHYSNNVRGVPCRQNQERGLTIIRRNGQNSGSSDDSSSDSNDHGLRTFNNYQGYNYYGLRRDRDSGSSSSDGSRRYRRIGDRDSSSSDGDLKRHKNGCKSNSNSSSRKSSNSSSRKSSRKSRSSGDSDSSSSGNVRRSSIRKGCVSRPSIHPKPIPAYSHYQIQTQNSHYKW